ncbi:MAG: hypothetical protein ATN31_05700 [Candidatus Epulonipiscioides saccharophilum]|nr:MAG: hypothetical protein ATN31_05700 [Epulopiscium sp. AS2M-Bin001]
MTDDNINNFYNQRIDNVVMNMGGAYDIDNAYLLANKSKFSLEHPIKIRYAEGWKVVNNTFIDFATILVLGIPFLLIPLFTHPEHSTMNQILFSTKRGTKNLVLARFLTAYLISRKFILLVF